MILKVFRSVLIFFLLLAPACLLEAASDAPVSDLETAYHFYKSHQYVAAMKVFENAKASEPEEIAKALVIKGFIFTDSISFESGRIYFEQASKLLEDSKDIKTKCKNFFGIGKGYFITNDFNTSVKYFLRMELEAIKAGLKAEQKTADYYLALNYQSLQQIPISNGYGKKAIALAKELKDSASVFRCDYTVAANFIYYTNYDTSTYIYFDSIMIVIRDMEKYLNKNDFHEQGVLHDLYAKAYNSKDDIHNRKMHILVSLNYYLLAADSANITGGFINAAQVYLELSMFDSALFCQKKAEASRLNELGLTKGNMRTFYYNYYKIYKGLGDQLKAFEYLEKFSFEDRDINWENNLLLQQLREDFETEKADLKITAENERTKALFEQKQSFYFYVVLMLFSVLILIAFFIYYRLKIKKEREQQSLKLLAQHAELTALKAQMNPHFIFNALNSIQHSIVSNNKEDAYRFLSKFSKLIRNVLDSSSEPLVPVSTELETLSLYLEIESKRFDGSFSFDIKISENGVSKDLALIPSMILQPLAENAIWHGLMPKEGEKILKIEFELLSQYELVCEIIDNGIGRKKAGEISSTRKNHKSKGIENIAGRIKLLERTHGVVVKITTTDMFDNEKAAGTKVRVEVNYLNKKK